MNMVFKKYELDEYDKKRTFTIGIDDLREAKIGDEVIIQRPPLYGRHFKSIEGEFSLIEIDGKKLIGE